MLLFVRGRRGCGLIPIFKPLAKEEEYPVELGAFQHMIYFEKSGSRKGAGVTGEKNGKLYMSGMLMKADSDDKYQIVVERKFPYTVR